MVRPGRNEMVCLLKSEGWDPIKLVQTTTILVVTCSKSGGKCALSFWKGKCLLWNFLLTNIVCLTNRELAN